eukprot:CAMPEP_0194692160 /NCGR_PEP_ID=MMETSP0295-20121207/19546_1 /TAXON_ID=39354 /ORGANISM="Heterosigma akashiwo, Strain CCMP2393" /LENGTH=648 /DNA_ID=CAMNT_0039582349 /DNA_START=278 /DNA_END=2224 /DNA_ORIENTATION=-
MVYELNDKDRNDPANKKLEGGADFPGPCEKRKCTDILFLLLLIACGVIPNDNLEPGNPQRLINGIDYNGHICGVDSAVSDKSKIYYLPSVSTNSYGAIGVCVDSCPSERDLTQFVCNYTIDSTFDSSDALEMAQAWRYVLQGQCMYHEATTDIFNYCIYDAALSAASAAIDQVVASALNVSADNVTGLSYETDSDSSWFDNFTADLMTAKYVILGFGVGVAMVVGFIYLFFLRIPGVLFMLTWGIIGAITLVLLLAAVLCYTTATSWASESPQIHSDTEAKGLLYFSYALFVVFGLWLLLILVLRKRIQLALRITKQASRAVAAMKLLMVWPVIQTLGVLVFLIPWTIYALYLASSGEVTVDSTGTIKTFTYDDNIRYAGLYLLFCWFWTSQFIIAMGQVVVAMAISFWYFTLDRSKIGNGTVLKAIRQSMWYHMGTAAFGSLIIAIIKTIRAIIAYLQKKAKKSGNKILQAVLCCIQCCMWCLEKCMKFLNKNAYIQTAIFGKSFCSAAKAAFFLIARNILRIAAVSMVGDFVLLLGKILIPMGTTFLAYLVLAYAYSDSLHGLYTPCVFVFLLAYFVALMFVEVFGMAISTCLQCFVADEEMGGHFTNQDLGKAISETNEEAKRSKGVGAVVVPAAANDGGGENLP